MSNAKYSPGPWKATIYGGWNQPLVTCEHGNICRVHMSETIETGEANTNLIAAAPDMLEALEYMIWMFEAENTSMETEAIDRAKKAIKKANGEATESAATAPGDDLMYLLGENVTDEEKATINRVVANMAKNDEIALKLLAALRFCKNVIVSNGIYEQSEKMAVEMANEAIGLAEGDYTEAESKCGGCMGPCGRCEETYQRVTMREMVGIIRDREREGKFLAKDGMNWIACDNTTGEAFSTECSSKEVALEWLLNGENCKKKTEGRKVGETVVFEHPTETFDGSEKTEGIITEDLGNLTYKVRAGEREIIINESDIF